MPVGRHIEGFVIVKHFYDVRGGRCVYDAGGDELVHGFVVRGFAGVMNETGTAAVDTAAEEGHAYRALVGDTL